MPRPTMKQPLSRSFDALFEPYDRADAPGLVIGVAQRGQLLYRRGFGMACLQHGIANTPATRMRIGSTTKHFTCLGILLLEQEGLLDIHQPVRNWLPDLDRHSGEPSLLQLMHHSGGLGDSAMTMFLANGGQHGHLPAGGTVPLLSRLRQRNFAPGTRMAYNNDGYTLLSLVIERLSGQSWDAFMRQRLFEPLRMSATALVRSDLELVPGMATPHLQQPDGTWRRGIHFSDELLGSGGLVSSIDDMLTWAAQLRGASEPIGGAALRARMLQPQLFADGTSLGYGLGLMTELYRGVDLIHHAGATLGTQCQLLAVPALQLDIVVMANRMDASAPALALKLLDAVLETLPPPTAGEPALAAAAEPAAAADHPALPGRWFGRQSRTLLSIEARQREPGQPEALLLSLYNAQAVALRSAGAGLARAGGPYSPLEIRQPPAAGQMPAQLEVHICGDGERFERLPAQPPAAVDLAPALCGRYRWAPFEKEVEILWRDGRLLLDLLPVAGMAEWELQPFAADVLGCGALRCDPPFPLPIPAALTLQYQDGAVLGFWLDCDRLRNVRFERL